MIYQSDDSGMDIAFVRTHVRRSMCLLYYFDYPKRWLHILWDALGLDAATYFFRFFYLAFVNRTSKLKWSKSNHENEAINLIYVRSGWSSIEKVSVGLYFECVLYVFCGIMSCFVEAIFQTHRLSKSGYDTYFNSGGNSISCNCLTWDKAI